MSVASCAVSDCVLLEGWGQVTCGRMNSSMLWNNKGCVTADQAYNKVLAKKSETDLKAALKQSRKEHREQTTEARRLEAVSAPDAVMQLVLANGGWQTGRGGVTKGLLAQVILLLEPQGRGVRSNERVVDLVPRVQKLMGWVEGVGFPAMINAAPAPAPPQDPEQDSEQNAVDGPQ